MTTAAPSPDLMKLLELAAREELAFVEAHHHRVQFYSSIISAVLAATIAGAINAKSPSHFLLLLAGPVLAVGLSAIAIGGTSRVYQRILEAITVRAKIEQALGLTEPLPTSSAPSYWANEPIIAPRHLAARRSAASAALFISAHKGLGYQKHTRLIFIAYAIVGFALGGALVFLAAR